MRPLFFVLLTTLVCAAPLASGALVIAFDALAHDGEHRVLDAPPRYEEAGFAFTAETGLAIWGSASDHYAGSAALFDDYFDQTLTLARVDGGRFDLVSIALAELFDDSTSVSVLFVGTRADTSTVVQSFTLDGFHDGSPASFEVFAFDPGFSDLVAVEWEQTADFHQFDDVTLVPVPEPHTGALLALALACLGRRRRDRGALRAA